MPTTDNVADALAIIVATRTRLENIADQLATDSTAPVNVDFLRDAADAIDGLLG